MKMTIMEKITTDEEKVKAIEKVRNIKQQIKNLTFIELCDETVLTELEEIKNMIRDFRLIKNRK
jgi:NADH:ubiquinone oxidoreductase subunit F (NADH-binding)